MPVTGSPQQIHRPAAQLRARPWIDGALGARREHHPKPLRTRVTRGRRQRQGLFRVHAGAGIVFAEDREVGRGD